MLAAFTSNNKFAVTLNYGNAISALSKYTFPKQTKYLGS